MNGLCNDLLSSQNWLLEGSGGGDEWRIGSSAISLLSQADLADLILSYLWSHLRLRFLLFTLTTPPQRFCLLPSLSRHSSLDCCTRARFVRIWGVRMLDLVPGIIIALMAWARNSQRAA